MIRVGDKVRIFARGLIRTGIVRGVDHFDSQAEYLELVDDQGNWFNWKATIDGGFAVCEQLLSPERCAPTMFSEFQPELLEEIINAIEFYEEELDSRVGRLRDNEPDGFEEMGGIIRKKRKLLKGFRRMMNDDLLKRGLINQQPVPEPLEVNTDFEVVPVHIIKKITCTDKMVDCMQEQGLSEALNLDNELHQIFLSQDQAHRIIEALKVVTDTIEASLSMENGILSTQEVSQKDLDELNYIINYLAEEFD